MSNLQIRQKLKWLSIEQEVKMATLRLTHKILYKNIPEELLSKMPVNSSNTRLTSAKKACNKTKVPKQKQKDKILIKKQGLCHEYTPQPIN